MQRGATNLSRETFFSATDIGEMPGKLMLMVSAIDSSLGVEAEGDGSGAVELSAGVPSVDEVSSLEPAPKKPFSLSVLT